jgi:hypothetical protein
MNTAISATTHNNYGGMSEAVTARHDATRTQKKRPRYCHGTRNIVTHANSLRSSFFSFLKIFFKKEKELCLVLNKRSSNFWIP